MTTSPRQMPTGGNQDGKRRSLHRSTFPLDSEYAHSPLGKKDRMGKKIKKLDSTDGS